MIGYGHTGQDRGGAGLQPTQRHPRDTRRRVGSYVQRHTAMGNSVAPSSAPPREPVSTGYGTVGGFPKQPRPRGKPAAMLTWGR